MEMDERGVGTGVVNDQEIADRLRLIESMMASGRRSTENWGWSFLLWGIAYLVAVAWAAFLPEAGGRALAWPIAMIAAMLLTAVIAKRKRAHQPRTDRSRSIQMLWSAVGAGIFVFAFPVAYSGHMEPHSFIAGIETLLGVAHIASGAMLRWKTQMVVGGLWWAAAVASCWVSETGIAVVFLAATLVCNIGFGIYLMVRESRDKARARLAEVQHA
jgi:hypothetical protein